MVVAEKLGLYRNKKVLITGHTGFKGSWLALWLTELGASVVGYSLKPPTEPSLFKAIGLEGSIIHIEGDVRDEEYLNFVFQEYHPEFIFHLAAQPLVRLSYYEPKLTYETNVIGTVNILEAVRKTDSVRACIIVTSDKCYENKEWVYSYRENDPLGGYDPYSSSKACAEMVTAAYQNSFFNPEQYGRTHHVAVASVRAGNVIGGGDWAEDRLVPDCIRALAKGETIVIRNPLAIRPWQYVLDPLAGYLLLAALLYDEGVGYSGAWNFAPPHENMLTVEEIVKLSVHYWGYGKYIVDSASHPHEARFLKLDASKARALLGWKPVYNIFETMERTINWYKSFYNGMNKADLYELTRSEIHTMKVCWRC